MLISYAQVTSEWHISSQHGICTDLEVTLGALGLLECL